MCCLTGQYHSAKKGLVQLAVLSGWHYQNKSKFFLIFFLKNCLKLSKKSSCSIFFVTTHYSHPTPPPPPLDTEIEVQLNFYPWSKFYFLLFQTHYHSLPYPKTYLPWQHGKLPVKESRDANLSCWWSGDSLFFTFPLSLTVNSPIPPLPVGEINQVNKILALLCAAH